VRDNESEVRPELLRTVRAVDCIESFINGVDERANRKAIKTGFDILDYHLGNGLYEGLYCIGAVSSAGKTTFVLQIADYISAHETDVLIFSLEMSVCELMAKSISRNTCLLSMKNGQPNAILAKETLDILDGSRYEGYTKEQTNVIKSAIKEYEKFQKNIYICEGVGDISVNTIKNEVKAHRDRTGRTPVVIVDYLQILSPHNEKATDKQNMDKSIVELKRLSRDFKTPVIAISSLNRASYGKGKQNTEEASELDIEMTAFKESGGIEYSCDVLMRLKTSDKLQDDRDVSLLILKNRNGKPSKELSYKYFARYNYFSENVNVRF